jgi:hypothetical protein
VATLDGHPLTGQRMPSLTNTKLKNIFELLRQFLILNKTSGHCL